MALLVYFLALTQIFHSYQCKKILVLLAQVKSHIFPVTPIAHELQRLNHSVTFVLSPEMSDAIGDVGVETLTAKSLNSTDMTNAVNSALLESKTITDKLTLRYRMLKAAQSMCYAPLEDNDLYTRLKKEEFDVAIVDYAPILCLEVLAYKLSLPFIYIGAHIDLEIYRVPFYPSFMPTFFSGFSDKMTFAQRIANTFLFFLKLILPTVPSFNNLVSRYATERPFLTNVQLKRSALLHIVDTDVLIEYALPIPPNMILCGGLAAKKPQTLLSNLERYANASNGIVIVSFGSILKSMPNHMFSKLMTAFKRMNQLNFIFRYGDVERLIENVLLLPWLPQNDLLGHPKTKLFITHCGKSGILEALYHGVPMLGFPMGMDQSANGGIIKNKGYGLIMNFVDFSVEELHESIKEVALTNIYRDKISVASMIFHSRPQTAPQRAAHWIDLVMKYGSDNFRSSAMDMSWYTYYMLDIGLFFGLLCATLIFTLIMGLRCLLKCCQKTNKKPKSE